MNTKPQDKLNAILSVDKNGNEGICMMNIPGIGPVLGVCGTDENLERLKKEAAGALPEAWAQGLKIVVGEFMRVETHDILPGAH